MAMAAHRSSRRVTHAVPRIKPNASISSQSRNLGLYSDLVSRSLGSKTASQCAGLTQYNLIDIGGGVEKESSEQRCLEVVRSILGRTPHGKQYKYECNTRNDDLKSLPPLFCTPNQGPDVLVFEEGNRLPVLVIEVHSSSYDQTIEKCIMSVMEQLRLYRSYSPDIDTCTGFAFPKLPTSRQENKQCVVKVQVTWKDLNFVYDLTTIPKEHVARTLSDTALAVHPPSTATQPCSEFVVTLSQGDLDKYFKGGANQERSRSAIIVDVGNTW